MGVALPRGPEGIGSRPLVDLRVVCTAGDNMMDMDGSLMGEAGGVCHKRVELEEIMDAPAAKRSRPDGYGFGFVAPGMAHGSDLSMSMTMESGIAHDSNVGAAHHHQLQQQQEMVEAYYGGGASHWEYFDIAAYEQADLMCMLPGSTNNRIVADPLGR